MISDAPTPASPTPAPAPAPAVASPALAAFLRGIERRAFVFAQVQCGQDREAMAAVERAMRSFHGLSAATPLSGWPSAFWSLLLAQAELSSGASGVPELASLGSGPRAALLLRLVAGLDFPHAARVLGVSEATYRFALQRALAQLAEAGTSYAALGQVRERLHRQVKTLGESRVDALATLRDAVLRGEPSSERVPALPATGRPGWHRWLWLVLALLALAFAATYWSPAPEVEPGDSAALPPEPATPAPPAPAGADVILHPDYAALADPAEAAAATDLAFHSWLAAERAAALPAGVPVPVPAPVAPAGDDQPVFDTLPPAEQALLSPLSEAWARFDPDNRRQVRAQAAHWLALEASGREALQARLADWDVLPAAERARRRGEFAAWQALHADERARVRTAAAAFAALPEPERQALRAEFDALSPDQRVSWRLGPELGAWFSPMRPLFAYVPGDERPPLLEMLRALSPKARADLAELARRVPASQREVLRRELLAAGPGEREALLAARLAQ